MQTHWRIVLLYLSLCLSAGAGGCVDPFDWLGVAKGPWPWLGEPAERIQWTYLTKGRVASSLAIAPDGTIYVSVGQIGADSLGLGDITTTLATSELLAVNPDGSLKWRFATDGDSSVNPAVGLDGTIYLGSWKDAFYAINPDGTLKWKLDGVGTIWTAPAVAADGTIYTGVWVRVQMEQGWTDYDGRLRAINPDGTTRWEFDIQGDLTTSPVIAADGTIYVGDDAHRLYAINPDGTHKWTALADGWFDSPAIGADGTIYAGSQDGHLYAFNPDGTDKWQFETDEEASGSPAIGADGTIYVPVYGGILIALAPDGTRKWQYRGSGYLSENNTPAIAADGTIYLGTADGVFTALDADSGFKWQFRSRYPFNSGAAIGPDGTVYVGSDDGHLYALHGDAPLADSPWPMQGRDLARTGRVEGP